jgi:DNA primase
MLTTDYVYTDSAGAVLGTITRMDNGSGKEFRASMGFPNPRPLYGLHQLAERPAAPVLVVEGEKTADAARDLLPGFVVVTSPFGAKSAAKADWGPLEGREVTIWPDHDEAGAAYAKSVMPLVPHAKLVDLGGLPEGWDLADDAPDGVDIAKRLAEAKTPKGVKFSGNGKQRPGAKAKRSKKDDLRRSAEDAKRERDALLAKVRALRSKTVDAGCTEQEAETSANKAKELMDEHGISDNELEFGVSDVEEDDFGT